MLHPLVVQLRFTRREFARGLEPVTPEQAKIRFGNLNCLSWIVGHLAWQEQRYWLTACQGITPYPALNDLLAYGKPACTPEYPEMWAAWREITRLADPFLDSLTVETAQAPILEGYSSRGTFLMRNIYHYWYHLGEGLAIRQMLGHTGLPDFVGDIDSQAPYYPEGSELPAQTVSKVEFIARVRQALARWQAYVERIPADRWLAPLPGTSWTLKDIQAHLTWHEREMIGLLRTRVLAGSEWWNLPTDQRNQLIYEENRDRSLEVIRQEAREIPPILLTELENLTDEDLNDPSRFEGMPSEWRPWDLIAGNTYVHYDDHLPAVEVIKE